MGETEHDKYSKCWNSGLYTQSKCNNFYKKISSFCFGKVLDIGAGNGLIVSRLLSEGLDAHGVDITKDAWETKSNVNPYFVSPKSRLTEASVCNLPYEDNEFDVTFSTTLMEHLPESSVDKAISEIARVTKHRTIHWIDTDGEDVQFGMKLHLTVKPKSWWVSKFEKFSPSVECLIFKKEELSKQ